MISILYSLKHRIDGLLSGRTQPESTRALWFLLVLGGSLYGGVMGSYGIETEFRPLQMLYSAIKTPCLLLITFAISLPSFFILNTLFGLRDDYAHVVRALVTAQAGLTIVLAALAPYTALWYTSFYGYSSAILFNAFMLTIASLAGQVVLRRAYRPLITRHARHRWMLWLWLVVYVFVGIQMGWVMRPLVGDPTSPVEFFRRSEWNTNAYVIVLQMVRRNLPRFYY